jgi:hypothetical protein
MKLLQTSKISQSQIIYEIIKDRKIIVHKFNIMVKSNSLLRSCLVLEFLWVLVGIIS